MPKEPIDPAEQSLGDGFQKLVQPKSKTPSGVWVIVGLAIFFALIAFGIAGFIVYEAVMAKRHAGEASPVVASATPATSARTSQTAAITATAKKDETAVAGASGTPVVPPAELTRRQARTPRRRKTRAGKCLRGLT